MALPGPTSRGSPMSRAKQQVDSLLSLGQEPREHRGSGSPRSEDFSELRGTSRITLDIEGPIVLPRTRQMEWSIHCRLWQVWLEEGTCTEAAALHPAALQSWCGAGQPWRCAKCSRMRRLCDMRADANSIVILEKMSLRQPLVSRQLPCSAYRKVKSRRANLRT